MSKKILLCVDDDAETLKIRQLLFESSGYSVVTADSADDALQLLAKGAAVDLVLLDYLMPGMNGDQFAKELRRQYPELPMVAVSAVGQLPEPFVEMLDATVQKGQDPQVLLGTVAAVLDRKASGLSATVLCVEDEQMQLQMRKVLFESQGYRVLTAESAQEALDAFRSNHIDAVVMDYWLSGQNGTAVAQEMKRILPRIPIVILSGFTSLPGEGTVVDSWMRKAEVEPQDLLNEVRRLIDLRSTAGRIAPST